MGAGRGENRACVGTRGAVGGACVGTSGGKAGPRGAVGGASGVVITDRPKNGILDSLCLAFPQVNKGPSGSLKSVIMGS